MKKLSNREIICLGIFFLMLVISGNILKIGINISQSYPNSTKLIVTAVFSIIFALISSVIFIVLRDRSCLWTSVLWFILILLFFGYIRNYHVGNKIDILTYAQLIFFVLLIVLPRRKNKMPLPISTPKQYALIPLLRIPTPWLWYEIIEEHDGIPRSLQRRGWFTQRATYPLSEIHHISSDSYLAIQGVANITFMLHYNTYITWRNVPQSIVDQL